MDTGHEHDLEWHGPMPEVSPETAPFWAACDRGVFLVQRCGDCGKTQYHYRGFCGHCWSERVEDLPSSGEGTVWTFSVVRKNRSPAFSGRGPYVVALIELSEGVKVVSNVVKCDPDAVHIGMPVRVAFAVAPDFRNVPVFVPA